MPSSSKAMPNLDVAVAVLLWAIEPAPTWGLIRMPIRGRRAGREHRVDAGQFLEVVRVHRDTEFECLTEFGAGFQRRAEHDLLVGESGGQCLGELACAGHFTAHAEPASLLEQRHQGVRFSRCRTAALRMC